MGHRKRRSDGLVMPVTEGEIECLPSSRRTAWIDEVRQWTEGGCQARKYFDGDSHSSGVTDSMVIQSHVLKNNSPWCCNPFT